MNSENEEMYELDELQKRLQSNETILYAKQLLSAYNIDEKDARIFLSAEMFVKHPDFFENTNPELLNIANKVYNKENLNENIEQFKIQIHQWKLSNVSKIKNEIQSMKHFTVYSQSEATDENCKQCFDQQNRILNVALEYFENQTPPP